MQALRGPVLGGAGRVERVRDAVASNAGEEGLLHPWIVVSVVEHASLGEAVEGSGSALVAEMARPGAIEDDREGADAATYPGLVAIEGLAGAASGRDEVVGGGSGRDAAPWSGVRGGGVFAGEGS